MDKYPAAGGKRGSYLQRLRIDDGPWFCAELECGRLPSPVKQRAIRRDRQAANAEHARKEVSDSERRRVDDVDPLRSVAPPCVCARPIRRKGDSNLQIGRASCRERV